MNPNGVKFWNCLVEQTDGGFHYKHESLESAITEAKRLARLPGNKGRKVYILEALGYCEVPETPVEYHPLGDYNFTIYGSYQRPNNAAGGV